MVLVLLLVLPVVLWVAWTVERDDRGYGERVMATLDLVQRVDELGGSPVLFGWASEAGSSVSARLEAEGLVDGYGQAWRTQLAHDGSWIAVYTLGFGRRKTYPWLDSRDRRGSGGVVFCRAESAAIWSLRCIDALVEDPGLSFEELAELAKRGG